MPLEVRCPVCHMPVPGDRPSHCPFCQQALPTQPTPAADEGAWWVTGSPASTPVAPMPSLTPASPPRPEAPPPPPAPRPPSQPRIELPPPSNGPSTAARPPADTVAPQPSSILKPVPSPVRTEPVARPVVVELEPATEGSSPGVLLGGMALVLGVLGFAAIWVPSLKLVGVVLAGLGLLLGLCVLLWALSRGAVACGFPAAGVLTSAQALAVAAILFWSRPVPVEAGGGGGGGQKPPPNQQPPQAVKPKLEDVPPLLDRPQVAKLLAQASAADRRSSAALVGDVAQKVVDLV